MTPDFLLSCILIGVALAMDAFAVSIATAMCDDGEKAGILKVSVVFATMQGLMPFIGWLLVNLAVGTIEPLEDAIPWIAFVVLGLIGCRMIREGIKGKEVIPVYTSWAMLLIMGIVVSIDALSVGLTTSQYDLLSATICSVIITVVTFVICLIGLVMGKRLKSTFANHAMILGGAILILIGLKFVIGTLL